MKNETPKTGLEMGCCIVYHDKTAWTRMVAKDNVIDYKKLNCLIYNPQ